MEQTLRQIIRAEIRALFEAVKFDNNKRYDVPDNVARASKKALEKVEKNNLTNINTSRGSGVRKAKELAEKKTQTHEQMVNLKSFFDTHEKEYKEAITKGLTINNSSALQSFELHGGISAKNWVNHKIKITKQSNLSTKANLRAVGGADKNGGMGIFAGADMISTTNHRISR